MFIKDKDQPVSSHHHRHDLAVSVVVALLYSGFLLYFVRWRHIFEMDPDEGYNLIKALLLHRGFDFFDQIWSDQPPFFSYVLWMALKTFGWDVNVGRMVTIAFVSLMIFGIFDTVRRKYGFASAAGAVLFLVVSRRFIGTSTAIMLGLPALSMAVMSIWAMVVWTENRRAVWLLVSGAFFGISISIKLFTLFIVPIVLICIALYGTDKLDANGVKKSLTHIALYVAFFTAVALILFYPAWSSHNFWQLIASHAHVKSNPDNMLGITPGRIFKKDKIIMLLSMLGLLYTLRYRNVVGTVFGLWLIAAWAVLLFHYPVWYHHAYLVLIPASVLAGSLAHYAETGLRQSGWKKAQARAVAFFLVFLYVGSYPCIKQKRRIYFISPRHFSLDSRDMLVTEAVKKYAGNRHIMVTSRQMYAFRTGYIVPPLLSVTSHKRYEAGLLDAQTILDCIKSYDVEQVILSSRWSQKLNQAVKMAISKQYVKVYSDANNRNVEIFVRKDLSHPDGLKGDRTAMKQ